MCLEIQKKIDNLLKKNKEDESSTLKKLLAFNLLLSSICIQSYHFEEESFETLDELQIVYNNFISDKKSNEDEIKPKKKIKLIDGEKKIEKYQKENKNKNMEILLDLLISLLTKSNCNTTEFFYLFKVFFYIKSIY